MAIKKVAAQMQIKQPVVDPLNNLNKLFNEKHFPLSYLSHLKEEAVYRKPYSNHHANLEQYEFHHHNLQPK